MKTTSKNVPGNTENKSFFRVTIVFNGFFRRKKIIENVVLINPVSGQSLLAIVTASGKTVCYLLNNKIDRYEFEAMK